MNGARESIFCLLDVGADPNILSPPGADTALSCAITASRDPTAVEMLSLVTRAGFLIVSDLPENIVVILFHIGLKAALVTLSVSQFKIPDDVVDSILLR